MPKKKPSNKKKRIKLPNLTPKKEALGGCMDFFKKPTLPIPPRGFFAGAGPAPPGRHR